MTDSDKLDMILGQLAGIEERLPPAVASPSQIRGEYGNPSVKFDPKAWQGDSCKGLTASQCPASFCELYAEALEWSARNPKEGADPKFITYNRKDAKLFRRWALENAKNPKPLKPPAQDSRAHADDDLAF